MDDVQQSENQTDPTDLPSFLEQSAVIRNSTLESTRRMLSYCAESSQTGAKTMEMMAVQGRVFVVAKLTPLHCVILQIMQQYFL